MDKLPVEVMDKLFSYFSLEELNVCERVCSRWSEIIVNRRWFPYVSRWADGDAVVRNKLLEETAFTGRRERHAENRAAYILMKKKLANDNWSSVKQTTWEREQSSELKFLSISFTPRTSRAFVMLSDHSVIEFNLDSMKTEREILRPTDVVCEGDVVGASDAGFDKGFPPTSVWGQFLFYVTYCGKGAVWDVNLNRKVTAFKVPVDEGDGKGGAFVVSAAANSRLYCALSRWKIYVYWHGGDPGSGCLNRPPHAIVPDFPEWIDSGVEITNYLTMYRVRMNEGFVVTLGCAPDSEMDSMNSGIHVREVTAENSGAITTKASVISADANGGEAIEVRVTEPPNRSSLMAVLFIRDQSYFIRVYRLRDLSVLREMSWSTSFLSEVHIPVQFLPSPSEDLLLLKEVPSKTDLDGPDSDAADVTFSVLDVNSGTETSIPSPRMRFVMDVVAAVSRFRIVRLHSDNGNGDEPTAVTSYDFWD